MTEIETVPIQVLRDLEREMNKTESERRRLAKVVDLSHEYMTQMQISLERLWALKQEFDELLDMREET